MSATALTLRSSAKMFDGEVRFYEHVSQTTNTPMRFSLFLPSNTEQKKLPILYWLSGLTCTEENATTKAGMQRFAAKYQMMVCCPDTSPRGAGIPGEDSSWDFGLGAGFYVDAVKSPWDKNYKMYSYITNELPALLKQHFPLDEARQCVSGHSMGGHGALTIAIKNPKIYRSVSAFAPIVAPSKVPWGEKAFSGYLGENQALWSEYDTCELIRNRGFDKPILVDQGLADSFLENQLRPELLESACRSSRVELIYRGRAGYDHSYYFIATFMEEHFAFHAKALGLSATG